VAELRWVLLAAGLVVLVVVFWLSRREARGEGINPSNFIRRRPPGLGSESQGLNRTGVESGTGGPGIGSAQGPEAAAQRIITIRLTAHGHGTFAGEALILALREAGLRHGRFGIFHRHDPQNESRIWFSVASLVEPGTFDLTRVKTERLPGISLFLVLPNPGDAISAFDDMLSTARALAGSLDGELLDEQGSRLSVQRERYLREEIIQFRHKPATS
jgi:cell division protein ZipA